VGNETFNFGRKEYIVTGHGP